MAGRFPGAQTISELWDVLQEGRETAFKTRRIG
jgi:acyl transferase domain-containing protein